MIADNGRGMPPGFREKLVRPFFPTKKDVGTGLGLWTYRAIVEKQEGSIRIRSNTKPGPGPHSRFFDPLTAQA